MRLPAPPPEEPPPEEPPPERELWPWLLVLLVLVLAGVAAAWYAARDSGTATPETVQTTVAAAQGKSKPARKHTTTATTEAVETVVVPGLVGQSRDDAVQTLEAQGLRPDVREVASEEPKETVVSQHPAGGAKVDRGSGVLLNVSSDPAKPAVETTTAATTAPATTQPEPAGVTVPDVTGQSLGAASDALRSAGLLPSSRHVPSTEAKDSVVSQSPGGGARAQRGDHVLLNV
jgi:serine/threonine-protein kinase